MRETFSLHADWRFHLGDIAERNHDAIHRTRFQAPEWIKAGNHGLSKPTYPDARWQRVDLPHDFVVESPFSPDANTVHGSKVVGVGWYRKTFVLPREDAGRRIRLEFDGVYRDAQVWMNGHFVGRHLSGYTSFAFDVTEVCRFGEANTIAVRADATQFELWSYEGGGIYRDVRLVKTDPVHIPWCGTFVHTSGDRITAEITVRNDRYEAVTCRVASDLVDAGGALAASREPATVSIEAGSERVITVEGTVADPRRWDVDDPYQYRVVTVLSVDGVETDRVDTPVGFRSFHFDAKTGFHLNGRPLKLKGVCEHQDHAGVGTAIPEPLYAWRLQRLKDMGCNAIRTAHNPPSPVLLDLCDRMGFLVIDETRMVGACHEALGQLELLIRRDRNHPSVILWSLGNEEMAVQDNETGIRQFHRMQQLAHRLDPTRPATYAMNCDWLHNAGVHDNNGFRFDVYGANYTFTSEGVDATLYDTFHERHPDWPLVGAETGGSAATRGLYGPELYEDKPLPAGNEALGVPDAVYINPARTGMVTAYNEMLTPWGTPIDQVWRDCAERPFLAGTFLWTGFDYRGETYPYGWPAVITRYGLHDLCGFPKDAAHYYRAQWRPDEPYVHLLPHWNWHGRDGEPVDVRVYTNCAAVELRLNDTVIEHRPVAQYTIPRWDVPYTPGRLEAVGFDTAGDPVASARIETTGTPAGLRLCTGNEALRADGRDVAVFAVAVVDAEGRTVPTADNHVHFAIEGPAVLLGVGNGNPTSHEPDTLPERRAFHGLCQVILQSTREPGTVRLTATGDGLAPAELLLPAEAVDLPAVIDSVDGTGKGDQAPANPVDERL